MFTIAQEIGIDDLVILGDFADFYAVNSHGKDPSIHALLKEEIDSVNSGLDTIDRLFPSIKKTFIEGNHCYRLNRYIQNKAPEIFGLFDCEGLFKMNQRPGWKWVSYGPNQKHRILNSKLFARHEPLGTTSKLSASRSLCSFVHGHIHRIEEAHITGLEGQEHVVFSCGWLGDKRKDKIFGYVKGHHQWQLGFAIVYVEPETGFFYHEKIHILENYTCVVQGKLYKG
jgi:UDP-2,3-diacylglucosamine pyrophosphatase LpxH